MRIGILTGGGDVPGLNPAIKAVVTKATAEGHEVLGLRRGWASVLGYDLDDDAGSRERFTLPLDWQTVRKVERDGGTFLHTSRTNPGRVAADAVPEHLADQAEGEGPHDFTAHAVAVLERLGIDMLVPIGGDDTLGYGYRLHQEGVPVVAIPKTMDNDVNGTDYCIGFSTAISRSVTYINQLRSATGSHERIAVVELFGRYSGQTSLIAGYLASADRVLIPEVEFDIDRLAEQVMADRARNPSNYAVVTVSEGAKQAGGSMHESGEADAFGHRKLGGVGDAVGDQLKERTGVGIIGQVVGYLMRSGTPDALDLMVATNYGTLAASLVLSGTSGQMVALRDGQYTHVPIGEAGQDARCVDVDAMYDVKEYRPLLREVAGKPMFLY